MTGKGRITTRCLLQPIPLTSGAAKPELATVLAQALKKAWKSGSSGFVAGSMQVLAFMWLRTVMNYQYKNKGKFFEVLNKLYKEGGIPRLYQGVQFALFQAPLSRFGDVASNDMVLAIMGALFPSVPVGVATFGASMTSASFRVLITPVDTCKTILQTDGKKGIEILRKKVNEGGILQLWAGWEANYVANVVGNYPWFAVFNALQNNVRVPKGVFMKLIRTAVIGAIASSVSDVVSNGIRVVKVKKQTDKDHNVGYVAAMQGIIDQDGLYGLLFRGLETKIFTNVLQGMFFTVLWKYLSSGGGR